MRSRPSTRATLALAALVAFTVWITWRAKAIELGEHSQSGPSPLLGKLAPEFGLESLDGRKVSLADYRGRPLVVTFWASWCGPCRLEMPMLAKFYEKTHKSGSDFEILAISIDTTKDAAQEGATSLKIPFPVLLDKDSRVADSYFVEGIPTLFVVDKTRKVIYSSTGFQMGLDFMLAQQLNIKNYSPLIGEKK
jgi:thiol-disulfide isomerase/thioredoxin